jgi:hypothetical protein
MGDEEVGGSDRRSPLVTAEVPGRSAGRHRRDGGGAHSCPRRDGWRDHGLASSRSDRGRHSCLCRRDSGNRPRAGAGCPANRGAARMTRYRQIGPSEAEVAYWGAGFRLAEGEHDLFLRELRPLHGPDPFVGVSTGQFLRSRSVEIRRAGQPVAYSNFKLPSFPGEMSSTVQTSWPMEFIRSWGETYLCLIIRQSYSSTLLESRFTGNMPTTQKPFLS